MLQLFTKFRTWRRILAILVVVIACRSGPVFAQIPRIGDIQVLPVINVSLQVGSTGKESKQATYSPPPGWYIRSHQVMCIQRYGTSSYAVSTVPAGWVWNSEEQFKELHERLADVAVKAENVAIQLKLNAKRDDTVYDLLKANSGKHALILETNATGGGLFHGGSGIQLRVFAEMVYIGMDRAPITLPSLGSPLVTQQTVQHAGGSK